VIFDNPHYKPWFYLQPKRPFWLGNLRELGIVGACGYQPHITDTQNLKKTHISVIFPKLAGL